MLNSSRHSKAMVPVNQNSMAADCGSSTIKSVVGKTVTSKPSTTLESKQAVRSFPEKKMAPFVSSKKAGLVSLKEKGFSIIQPSNREWKSR